ncbi:hypothetical protein F5Y16DRAFT_415402 [Xylariaceae sp. FL0255]|nr:hypothetical protein F5Y16DRAFT_415402 [Xylariaceae sp. FL0255]
MESIKRFFNPNKEKRDSKGSKKRPPNISAPLPGSFTNINSAGNEDARALVLRHSQPSSTTSFVPLARGRNATVAYLRSGGTPESLRALKAEQKHAAKDTRLGPRTKGTRQVQQILRAPSRRAVEELCRVRQQAEMVIRYGAPGLAAYNFSMSLGWNTKKGAVIPSLQLHGAVGRTPVPLALNPLAMHPIAVPYTPINWLILSPPQQEHKQEPKVGGEEISRCWSPVSEAGGWRDDADRRLYSSEKDKQGLFVVDDNEEDEEGESDPYDTDAVPNTPSESEAQILSVTPVPRRQVRKVCV